MVGPFWHELSASYGVYVYYQPFGSTVVILDYGENFFSVLAEVASILSGCSLVVKKDFSLLMNFNN